MFLVFKDSKWKTQVHHNTCEFRGQKGRFQCSCPVRLTAGSVDSLIGQIRAIYRDFGRGSDWNDLLGIDNPAAVPVIKRYLEDVRLEQSLSSVTPRRAVPLFMNKLSIICRHVTYILDFQCMKSTFYYATWLSLIYLVTLEIERGISDP